MRVDELSPITGEFILGEPETSFRAERFPVTIQQARMVFALVAIGNLLYFFSEWRFHEPSTFYVILFVRCFVIAVAVAALFAISNVSSFKRAEAVILAWAVVTCPAIGVLVATHGNTALFVTMTAPSVCWLLLPMSFRLVAGAGVFCSAVMLLSYGLGERGPFAMIGLVLVMLLLNGVLAAAILRSNRLSRQEWGARERERRAKDELAESRDALQRMLMCVPVPLLVVSKADGRLVHANDAAVEFLGGHPEDIGMRFLSDLRADLSQPVKSLDATGERAPAFRGRDPRRGRQLAGRARRRARSQDRRRRERARGRDRHHRPQALGTASRPSRDDRFAHRARQSRGVLCRRRAGDRAFRCAIDKPPALLMVDMDHFKQINDTYGHETGDVVLRSFSKLCRRLFRSRDIIGRIGGEEFAVLLPQMNLEAALARAERLRAGAEKLRFRGRAVELRVTASIGVSFLLPGEKGVDAALSRADKALYSAKRAGRNRVAVAEDTNPLSEVA